MGYGIIDTSTLTDIADAIRGKLGVQTQYRPNEMPEAIESISGGGITPTGTKSITANGTYDVASYASAEVNVPQSGITPTGTKQVSITANGTTTEDVTAYANAQISVNVVNQDYVNALTALGVTEDLTDGIEALTTYANGVTGESDTTLSDAVASLADGYGQGGGYTGLEYAYDTDGAIERLVWHGNGIIPNTCYNSLFNNINKNVPISFPDNPIGVGKNVFSNARLKLDWDSLGKELLSCSANGFGVNYYEDCSAQIVRFPKLTGETINGMNNQNAFAYTSAKAPGTYYFDTMQIIPREFFTNISHTSFSITFGSVGHAVTSCGSYPFHNSTAAASGTVTTYTTGEYLDTVRANLESYIGSGTLTFVYKASEATTYNGTSYNAGDTITV